MRTTSRPRRTPRRFARHDGGAIAIEFAMLMPVMAVLLFGGFEATRMLRASIRLNDVAQTVADLVAQQTTVTAAGMVNICNGGGLVMAPFSSATLDATVASVTYASTGAGRVLDWQDTTCGAGGAIGRPTTLAVAYTPNVKDSLIIVQAVFVYKPIVNTVFATSFTMTRMAYARPRDGSSVSHY